jgi:hypothetical protein
VRSIDPTSAYPMGVGAVARAGDTFRLEIRIEELSGPADLLDGSLLAPVNLTETGIYLGNHAVWTDTYLDGGKTTERCNDWTDNAVTGRGTNGSACYADDEWSSYGGSSTCDFSYVHLYSIED